MNFLLFDPEELQPNSTALLQGSRAEQVMQRYSLTLNAPISAGVLGGKLGEAILIEQRPEQVQFSVNFYKNAPERLPVHLILGICRPQTIKKVLQFSAAMGLQSVHFIRTDLSDKSYLQSNVLEPQRMYEEMRLSLEQVGDTAMPQITIHQHWKRFYEDELAKLSQQNSNYLKILATPGEIKLISNEQNVPGIIMAIGPEPGWSNAETAQYIAHGFKLFSLGPRQLRVEHAVEVICGHCLPLCQRPTST